MMDGACAIAAATIRQPPDRVLVVYDKAESKFQYSAPPEGYPLLLAFQGELVLRPDVESAFEGRPSANSRNEVYFEGENPLVYLHGTAVTRLLNLSTGAMASSHGGQMIGFRKWSICTREGGELFTLMEFKPNPAWII